MDTDGSFPIKPNQKRIKTGRFRIFIPSLVVDLDRVELHRLDPFHRHEPLGKGLELASVTVDKDDFEALVMGHV